MKMDWSRYPNFSEDEFGGEMNPEFMRKLQLARQFATQICKSNEWEDQPFVISSGKRDEELNQAVGGKDDSAHLIGRAADIVAGTSRSRYIIICALLTAGFTRISIYYEENFIHVDDAENAEGEYEKVPYLIF